MLGQGLALASIPARPEAPPLSVAAASDCMESMEEDPGGEPCKGITLDCIAAMGCVVPFMLATEQPALGAPAVHTIVQPAASVARLRGRVPSPAFEPPTS